MKIVVAGGFAVGKTTFVGAISEIDPLRTEAEMTVEGLGVDNVGAVEGKTGTTVAMDFGRITIGPDMVLYLFGTPGQDRFWFMWDELARGSIGGVVLVDTRRLEDCFPAVDYFEALGVPFVVACNLFDGRRHAPSARGARSVACARQRAGRAVRRPPQVARAGDVDPARGRRAASGPVPPGALSPSPHARLGRACTPVRSWGGRPLPSGDAGLPEERRRLRQDRRRARRRRV